eukprot:10736828-Lingulodinium_polyedra.AAC.1
MPKAALSHGAEGDTLETIFAHLAADLQGLFYMAQPARNGFGHPWPGGSAAAALAGKPFKAPKRA